MRSFAPENISFSFACADGRYRYYILLAQDHSGDFVIGSNEEQVIMKIMRRTE